MKDFNQLIISGRILDPLRISQDRNNNRFLTGEIENRRSYTTRDGPQEDVSRLGIVAWNKTAEALAQALKVGDWVMLHGKLKQELWTDGRGIQRSELAMSVSGFILLEASPENAMFQN